LPGRERVVVAVAVVPAVKILSHLHEADLLPVQIKPTHDCHQDLPEHPQEQNL
jgi:hypothetical protein